MKARVGIVALFALSGCTSMCAWVSTPEQQDAEERRFYRGHSTPENVASDPDLRALIPTSATPDHQSWPNQKDMWVTPEPLPDVLAWYKREMRDRGYIGTLRQCGDGSIYGGLLLIIEYCSSDKYAKITIGEEATLHKTILSVSRFPRTERMLCNDPREEERRKLWTASCPAGLWP
jgi:hypothetical protein